jgi:hypothetical protein
MKHKACQKSERCTHALALTVASKQKYLSNQKKADRFTVVNAYQNTVHKEDFRIKSLK